MVLLFFLMCKNLYEFSILAIKDHACVFNEYDESAQWSEWYCVLIDTKLCDRKVYTDLYCATQCYVL